MMAAPLVALVPGLGLGGGYFEMLACLTTTGATLFDRPRSLPSRSICGDRSSAGSGGLMVLVTAFAILAPLNLGGFEIGLGGSSRREASRSASMEEASARILRSLRHIRQSMWD